MALTKEEYDCEVRGPYKAVSWQPSSRMTTTRLAAPMHRHDNAHQVGDTWGDTDISGEDASVQAVCNALWASIKSAYETL